jgi:hypothetical protein
MKVELTPEESESYFHTALCNGMGYMRGYDLCFNYEQDSYGEAKKNLQLKSPGKTICYEDVIMGILKNGGYLELTDNTEDSEYTKRITIKDVHEKVSLTPFDHLSDMIAERDDADTADAIIQTVFYGEVIFG